MESSLTSSYQRRVISLIIILSFTRLITAFNLELGNDESYYWLYAQDLKWNYFDHPPMVAIWIRLFTVNLSLQQYPGFIRLGSIVGCALSSWFIYKCTAVLSTEKAGWFAACLYNASFYTGIYAGIFIMPDSPQMVFWTLSLWMIAKITTDEKSWLHWLIFGISSGLCIMSKVHGIFIWMGLGLYVLFYRRTWLINFRLYIALVLAVAISTPILIWNIQNNFVTYSFDSQRVGIIGFSTNWYSFLKQACGQFLINNPFNVILIFLALFTWRHHAIKRIPALTIYNFTGLLLASIVLFISLYREGTLPHWSGPAYVTLIPLAAVRLSLRNKTPSFPKFLSLGIRGYVFFLVLCLLAIHYYPGNFGSKATKDLGTGDLTLDMYGWKEAGKQFDSIYESDINKGITSKGAPVVCYKWWGAHQEYYFCRRPGIQMIGLGDMNNLHEYMWMNKRRKDYVNFASAYCIEPSDELYDVRSRYSNYYNRIDSVATIKILRGAKPAHNFYIYRLTGWKNNLPAVQ